MKISRKQIKDWKRAMNKKTALNLGPKKSTSVSKTRWKTPEQGYVKLNVDASIFNGTTSFSTCMLIRNDKGNFVQSKAMKFQE